MFSWTCDDAASLSGRMWSHRLYVITSLRFWVAEMSWLRYDPTWWFRSRFAAGWLQLPVPPLPIQKWHRDGQKTSRSRLEGCCESSCTESSAVCLCGGLLCVQDMSHCCILCFGQLSPALRNRFTEIWCPQSNGRSDLVHIIQHNLRPGLSLQGKLKGSVLFWKYQYWVGIRSVVFLFIISSLRVNKLITTSR